MASENLTSYFSGMRQRAAPPKDPWSHAHSLLTNDDNVTVDDDVVNKQAQLSFIGDDKMLRLYQNDEIILTQMKNMAQREPALAPVFGVMYQAWIGELKLTKVLKGMERQLQGTTGGSYLPRDSFGAGYGEQFADDQRRAEENQVDAGAIAGFFKKMGKKR
jgi:hypothetical protein